MEYIEVQFYGTSITTSNASGLRRLQKTLELMPDAPRAVTENIQPSTGLPDVYYSFPWQASVDNWDETVRNIAELAGLELSRFHLLDGNQAPPSGSCVWVCFAASSHRLDDTIAKSPVVKHHLSVVAPEARKVILLGLRTAGTEPARPGEIGKEEMAILTSMYPSIEYIEVQINLNHSQKIIAHSDKSLKYLRENISRL
jgi:hypothetical protein